MATGTPARDERRPIKERGAMAEWSSGFRSGVRVRFVTVAALSLAIGCGEAPEPASTRRLAASTRRLAASTAALTGRVCSETDTHGVHAKSRIPCSVCHPVGGVLGFSTVFTYPGGTTTAGGTITRGSGGAPTSCSVSCHSPLASTPHTVTWGTPGPLDCTACHDITGLPSAHPSVKPTAQRSDCLVCHDQTSHTSGTVTLVSHPAGWMDPTNQTFHAYSAGRGLASCEGCHGPGLTGGMAKVGCAQCHDRPLPGGGTLAWSVDCTMCHGGTDNPTGAPPKGIWGAALDPIRVGAHTSHLASAIAPAMDCKVCHVKPANAFSDGHINSIPASEQPRATVEFTGLASIGVTPTWDRASRTCANTYCHGATVRGGSNKTPDWTIVDGTQAACDTCHGAPPPYPHPAITGGPSACNPCHSLTIDQAGAIIPPSAGGKHLNGNLEATGHDTTWMDQASSNFHAYSANRGLGSCQGCHGPTLDGGIAPTACSKCHGSGWSTSCTMCHGGLDNQTGAPPRTVWQASADTVRVGAHTRHLAGSALSRAFGCGECHVTPVNAFSTGHISVDDYATVTFSALAAGTGTATWTRSSARCSTYCHGATLPGGTNKTPLWTGGASQATCGACHPAVPTSGKHWHVGDGLAVCGDCHGARYGTGTSVDLTLHVNGVKDIGNAITQWDGKNCFTTCHGSGVW
jgi:predicted CxxxxCH...CXXCH cytochrome family protein